MHWTPTLTSSYSKTFVFNRPHEYDKVPFLKIYSLESVFKNLRISGRKRFLRVDGRCKRRKKISVFENIRIFCGRGLRVSFGAVFQAFLARLLKSWILQTFRFSRIQKVIIARSISTTLTSRLTAWQNCANSTLCWVNKPSKTSWLTVSENDVKAK